MFISAILYTGWRMKNVKHICLIVVLETSGLNFCINIDRYSLLFLFIDMKSDLFVKFYGS